MIEQVLVSPAGVAFASPGRLDCTDYGIKWLTVEPHGDSPKAVKTDFLEGPVQFGEHLLVFWPRRAWDIKLPMTGTEYALMPAHGPDAEEADEEDAKFEGEVMSAGDFLEELYSLRGKLESPEMQERLDVAEEQDRVDVDEDDHDADDEDDVVAEEEPDDEDLVEEEVVVGKEPVEETAGPKNPGPFPPRSEFALGQSRYPLVTTALSDEAPDAPIAIRARHIRQRVFPQQGNAVATNRDLARFTEEYETSGVVLTRWRSTPVAVAGVAGGELSGEQAAVVAFVETVIEKTMPLIEAAEPLVIDADPEDVEAARVVLVELLNRTFADVSRTDGWQTAILETRARGLAEAVETFGLELGMLVERTDDEGKPVIEPNVHRTVNSGEASRLTEFQILEDWVDRLVEDLHAIVASSTTIAAGTYGIQQTASVAAQMATTTRDLIRRLTNLGPEVLETIEIPVNGATLTAAALFDELEGLPEHAGIIEPAGITAAKSSVGELELLQEATQWLCHNEELLDHPMIRARLGHIEEALAVAVHQVDELTTKRTPWLVRSRLGAGRDLFRERTNGSPAVSRS